MRTLELLVNDLSFHGQFSNIVEFRKSLERLMQMKMMARRFEIEVYSHRNMVMVCIMPDMPMQKVLQLFSKSQRLSLLSWLSKRPFWDEERSHGPDDYLEYNDKIVTDTAVGEAAYCCLRNVERHLVSLTPSAWDLSPVEVKWYRNDNDFETVTIPNYRRPDDLEATLRRIPDIVSWDALRQAASIRCPHLNFTANSFEELRRYAFNRRVAEDILRRLEILECLQISFDARGQRTTEGHQIYMDYFTGKEAWFSDSSNTEKNKFRIKLTFPHPEHGSETLFCPWHGKVNHRPPLRIHFSWPIQAATPCYVVYIGPKLTI